jgi:hypothetical protein
LFARIGLESDTNANTTRRLLLISESVSVLQPAVTEKIKKMILVRYLGDYAPAQNRLKPVRVPHFLLNDLVRYWRTMAVDFGAKQWRSITADWYLRYSKLLITRKVLFAGTLAILLDTENALRPLYDSGQATPELVFDRLVDHVTSGLQLSPLARLMSLEPRLSDTGQIALVALLSAYNDFIGMLDDRFIRGQLVRGESGGSGLRDFRAEAEELARTVHDALRAVFHDDPLLGAATREYALF